MPNYKPMKSEIRRKLETDGLCGEDHVTGAVILVRGTQPAQGDLAIRELDDKYLALTISTPFSL